MKYIIFLMVTLSFQSCTKVKMPLVDYTYDIIFTNESNGSVAPFMAYGGYGYTNAEGPPYAVYPDTLLPKERPALPIVAPSGFHNFIQAQRWSELIEEVPGDTISLYVLDANVYQDSSWSAIRSKYLYLKRYSIAASEVRGSIYEIVYEGK